MTPELSSLHAAEVCALAPVIPVLVIGDAGAAAGLAEALVAGGLPALEVTLRTPAALEAIAEMARIPAAGWAGHAADNPPDVEAGEEAGATSRLPGLQRGIRRRSRTTCDLLPRARATRTEADGAFLPRLLRWDRILIRARARARYPGSAEIPPRPLPKILPSAPRAGIGDGQNCRRNPCPAQRSLRSAAARSRRRIGRLKADWPAITALAKAAAACRARPRSRAEGGRGPPSARGARNSPAPPAPVAGRSQTSRRTPVWVITPCPLQQHRVAPLGRPYGSESAPVRERSTRIQPSENPCEVGLATSPLGVALSASRASPMTLRRSAPPASPRRLHRPRAGRLVVPIPVVARR